MDSSWIATALDSCSIAAEIWCWLASQTSKEDFEEKLKRVEIDEKVPIVSLVVDCTTDHRSFHFCAASAGADTKELGEYLDKDEEVANSVLDFAMQLSARRKKDIVPLARIAQPLAALGARCHRAGKVLHVLLTGCNTVNLVLPVWNLLPEEARSSVWILATNSVWPGDMSIFLWHHYGSTVSVDLVSFRKATHVLLDEYTSHWKRQNIRDGSMEEHGKHAVSSLASLVMLDRMDKVKVGDGGVADMAML